MQMEPDVLGGFLSWPWLLLWSGNSGFWEDKSAVLSSRDQTCLLSQNKSHISNLGHAKVVFRLLKWKQLSVLTLPHSEMLISSLLGLCYVRNHKFFHPTVKICWCTVSPCSATVFYSDCLQLLCYRSSHLRPLHVCKGKESWRKITSTVGVSLSSHFA